MTKGTFLAVLFLAAYLGFEAYAIRKASHRTEPAYIYNLLVEAQTATQLCQSDALQLQARFERTIARVGDSYQQDLQKADPALTLDDLSKKLVQHSAAAKSRVTESINTAGCDTPEAKAHFQRYRIYAGKTR